MHHPEFQLAMTLSLYNSYIMTKKAISKYTLPTYQLQGSYKDTTDGSSKKIRQLKRSDRTRPTDLLKRSDRTRLEKGDISLPHLPTPERSMTTKLSEKRYFLTGHGKENNKISITTMDNEATKRHQTLRVGETCV